MLNFLNGFILGWVYDKEWLFNVFIDCVLMKILYNVLEIDLNLVEEVKMLLSLMYAMIFF